MQIRTVAAVLATVVGLVVYVADAPSSSTTPTGTTSGALAGAGSTRLLADRTSTGPTTTTTTTAGATPSGVTPVDQASTSTRGISGNTINVVFPVANLQALSSQIGFSGDFEFTEQAKAIKLYVNEINASGGINGRKINAIISNFDPTSESDMRSLCKDWTEGSPAAFAVVDGEGTWTGDDQLCITQEGQTPFIGAWTTVSNWTQMGSPYLWWTGPDQAAILATLVQWGKSARPARRESQGRGRRRGPGQRPAGPQPVPAAGPQARWGSPRWSRPSPPTSPSRRPPRTRRR